jgi:hypothetical protein
MESTITKTEKQVGFKPNATTRKLLARYSFDVCSYIYPDGIMIIEHRKIKQGKYESVIEVHHIFPCIINLRRSNYRESDNRPITRIVCHNSTVLIDGILGVEYYTDNCSESMKNKGMTCNTLTLITLNGAQHRTDMFDFIASDYTVQFDDNNLQEVTDRLLKDTGAHIEVNS